VRLALAFAVVLAAAPARADPPTKAQCLAAYSDGQDQRQAGQLRQARAAFALCASDPCPRALHADCTRWRSEVDRLVPTIVLGARGADGRDLADVRVTVDGALVAERLDGRGIEVDPGEHVLRFEAPGEAPVEQRLVIHEGEKGRAISVSFGAPPSPAAPAAAGQRSSGAPRPVTWPTVALAGVSVVSLAVFTYAGVSGLSRWEACTGGRCATGDKSYVDARWTVADVTGAVAIASAAAAAYLFVTRPAVTLTVAPGAAGLWLRTAF